VIFIGGFVSGVVYLFQGFGSAKTAFDRLNSEPPAREVRPREGAHKGTPLEAERALPAGMRLVAEVRRKDGVGGWTKQARVIPGDVVVWRLKTENAGARDLLDVTVRVVLGPQLELIPGSVHFVRVKGEAQLKDGPLFGGGYNAGRYLPGDGTYYVFDTRSLDDFEGCAVRTRSFGLVHARGVPELKGARPSNSADVIVGKTHC